MSVSALIRAAVHDAGAQMAVDRVETIDRLQQKVPICGEGQALAQPPCGQ